MMKCLLRSILLIWDSQPGHPFEFLWAILSANTFFHRENTKVFPE